MNAGILTVCALVLCLSEAGVGSNLVDPVAEMIPANAWGSAAGGLRVAVWAPRDTFPIGQAYVIMAVQNVSNERVVYELLHEEAKLFDSDCEVPLTRLGRRLSGLDPQHPRRGSQRMTYIEPGEVFVLVRNIGAQWDLSVSGDYSLHLAYQRRDYGEPGKPLLPKAAAVPVRLNIGGQPLTELSFAAHYQQTGREFVIQRLGHCLTQETRALADVAKDDPSEEARQEARDQLRELSRQVQSHLRDANAE